MLQDLDITIFGLFASFVKHIKGDFLFVGISYGVAPRVVYDFLDFGKLNKKFILVDSFIGEDNDGFNEAYNTSIEFVKEQYPKNSPVIIEKQSIPDYFINWGGGCKILLCSS